MSDRSRAIVRYDIIQALAPFIYNKWTAGGLHMGYGRDVIGIEGHPTAGCVLSCNDGACFVAIHDPSATYEGLPQSWRVPVKTLDALLPKSKRYERTGTTWCELTYELGQITTARLVQSDRASMAQTGTGTELACVDDTETGILIREDYEPQSMVNVFKHSSPKADAPAGWFNAHYLTVLAKLAQALEGTKSDNLPMSIQHADDKEARISFYGLPQLLIRMAGYGAELHGTPRQGNPKWAEDIVHPPFSGYLHEDQ